jgi:hypothetical protein
MVKLYMRLLDLCSFNQERSNEAGYIPLARPGPV